MKKLILRWIGLVVGVAILAVVFVQLGEWQLRRLDERRENNAIVVEHQDASPLPYREVFTGPIADDDQWQRVVVTGTYTGDQYQVRYRNQDGAGIEVVAVMETDQGDHLLINRGFIRRQPGQPDPEILPALPAGDVEVIGYVRRSEHGKPEAIDPHEYKVRLINAEAIGSSLGIALLDGYVSVIESSPPEPSDLEPLRPPELTEGPHLMYAVQWFAFTAIAAGGVVILIRADLRDRKKAQRRAAAATDAAH
ncbi:MAG TPA: SURF1 family protein [Arachnia sp.]|nr:SURF1 family protein [Arachnia sp.]HMT85666.1 SURF1 family protein [Arachnia sp.]